MNILVTMKVFNLKLSMGVFKGILEGKMSLIFKLGNNFYSMSKNGLLLVLFLNLNYIK